MKTSTYAVTLSGDFLSRSGRLLEDYLRRLPLQPEAQFLLCDEFDPTGPMVKLQARMNSTDERTVVFLHHHAIEAVFVLDSQRDQFGFLGGLTTPV